MGFLDKIKEIRKSVNNKMSKRAGQRRLKSMREIKRLKKRNKLLRVDKDLEKDLQKLKRENKKLRGGGAKDIFKSFSKGVKDLGKDLQTKNKGSRSDMNFRSSLSDEKPFNFKDDDFSFGKNLR